VGCFSSRTQHGTEYFYNSNLVQSANFDPAKSLRKKQSRRVGKQLGAKFMKNIGDQIDLNSRAGRVSNELLLDNYLAKHKRNVARSTYQNKTNFNKFFQQNYVIAKAQNQTLGAKWSLAGGTSSLGSKSSGVVER